MIDQSFKNFEIIIIDGLSTDSTLNIACSFEDDRIKYISEQDKGIYDAMNKGIELAAGEYLYFLGSDDTLYDNYVFEKVALALKRSFSVVLYGNVKINGDAGWASDKQIYDGEFDTSKILKKNISHQAIFYKKEILEGEKFNIAFKICADYDLNLRLFSRYKFQYDDLIVATFNGGGKSVSAEDKDFDLHSAAINYFYKELYKNEFSILRNSIRKRAMKTKSTMEMLYLNAIYIKHRLT